MSKKEKTPEQKILNLAVEIPHEIDRWMNVKDNGCNNPFWWDGCNMNLIRNHIIYYKHQILELCLEHNLEFPEEYGLPLPPKVENTYMADLKQCDRLHIHRPFIMKPCHYKIDYDSKQLSLI